VLEAILERCIASGGEQSGQLIFLDRHTTGDGILTVLRLLGSMPRAESLCQSSPRRAAPALQVLLNVSDFRRKGSAPQRRNSGSGFQQTPR
jgi:phosphoglucosamine mutase